LAKLTRKPAPAPAPAKLQRRQPLSPACTADRPPWLDMLEEAIGYKAHRWQDGGEPGARCEAWWKIPVEGRTAQLYIMENPMRSNFFVVHVHADKPYYVPIFSFHGKSRFTVKNLLQRWPLWETVLCIADEEEGVFHGR